MDKGSMERDSMEKEADNLKNKMEDAESRDEGADKATDEDSRYEDGVLRRTRNDY